VTVVDFRATALRASTFFGTGRFVAAFFLTAVFFVTLLFAETFALLVLRDAAFCATARLAFGRAVFRFVDRRLATDLGEDRRAVARDVERLRPLVTALISAKVART
jgi:hypothetical protein